MRKQPDQEHFIPIWDCPKCKEELPLSSQGPFRKEGYPDIYVWYCPGCDLVPMDDMDIKGYMSFEDLKTRGWIEEKVSS